MDHKLRSLELLLRQLGNHTFNSKRSGLFFQGEFPWRFRKAVRYINYMTRNLPAELFLLQEKRQTNKQKQKTIKQTKQKQEKSVEDKLWTGLLL